MAGGEGSVKLLGASPSSYVNRVQIALNLKSIEYEFLQETFFPKSDLLLTSNPIHKKIPVFFHNDKPICESLIILQYIDEQWSSGPSILPLDAYDRSIVRFWAAYVDDKLAPTLREYRGASEEERLVILGRLSEGLVLLEEVLVKSGKNTFFGGENIGYLDIAFGSFLGWFKATEKMTNVKILDESITPRLVEWAENFLSHEAVKGVIPETDVLIDLVKKIAAMQNLQPKN
ncbi:glutathione S-transferase U17-like [Impatiens glandulifera]|uniref:glutathione S-transferase U17-like n=1 Tax=Impatiens glandulifera TaxID=253017 RepID=UPI001FB0FD2A|nr:glutathione S-transferase U17-like [Impatiens glandulifera]